MQVVLGQQKISAVAGGLTGPLANGDNFGMSYRECDTENGEFIFPTTTPASFDPDEAHRSVDRIMSCAPRYLYLTHYSRVTDLERLAADMHAGIDAFVELALAHKDDADRGAKILEAMDEYLCGRLAEPRPEKIAEIMTIKVVVQNAKLLRPVWEISDHMLGLVSLQLSPKDAFDAGVMIDGATRIYEQLRLEICGTPNTVFKVPGTKAGITVASELTRLGIPRDRGVPVAERRVDILDAYRLALQLEAGAQPDAQWDKNGDGRVDTADVDWIARASVALENTE